MPDRQKWKWVAVVLLVALGPAGVLHPAGAAAESALLVDPPLEIGVIPAATFDVERKRVGNAHLVLETLDDGRLRMFSESGFTGGARTVMSAILSPADGTGKLRPVFQESRSFDAEGTALGRLSIDHEQRKARCQNPEGDIAGEVDLPEHDRVANITLNLFFLPLVRRAQEEISFQLFLCSGGAKLVDFVANLSPASRNGKRPHLLEVRYGPDFGIASMIARNFVPKLSVWFSPDSPHPWAAHRLPLYGNGPEVFIVREGTPTRWLADE